MLRWKIFNSREYIDQLSKDYHEFIQQFKVKHPDISVIELNGDKIDFLQNEADLQKVIQLVKGSIKELKQE